MVSVTKNNTMWLSYVEWMLGSLVMILAISAWVTARQVGIASLTIYDVFPLLGLVAFSLMWTHFIMGMLRRMAGVSRPRHTVYGTVSFGLVLALLILHPGILWYSLWRDGFGLPPVSYLTVYGTTNMMTLALLCGTISLFIFLAFELRRKYGKKSWWKYVNAAQIPAMFAIFYHALTLGKEVKIEWFQMVWWLYGVTLLVAIGYTYWYDKTIKKEELHE